MVRLPPPAIPNPWETLRAHTPTKCLSPQAKPGIHAGPLQPNQRSPHCPRSPTRILTHGPLMDKLSRHNLTLTTRDIRGHPTNVPRLPTPRPRRPTIHKTHTNNPTHPTSNTSTPIYPARTTKEPHRHKRPRHNISAQPIFQAQAPRITGITHNFLGAEHISAKQQPRTQRPCRTTPRLRRHSIHHYIIERCTQNPYNPFQTRYPPRRVPTT